MTIEYKKTCCPLDCPDSCGIIAKVENGKVVSLAGDPDHPYTNGFICRKIRGYPKRLYSKDRILYPLKRIGKKGSAEFARISWEEALSSIADTIRKVVAEHGGEAILPYQYAGNMGFINRNGGYALYNKLNCSILQETICSTAAGAGWSQVCGDMPGSPPELAARAELLVVWGSNTKVTNMHFWQYIARARKNGARLVVIDPYQTITAQSADLHLKVKPGGDGALALGILKALVEQQLLNGSEIASHSNGFEELESYLKNEKWSEFVRLSGIERADIEELATLLGSNQKTFLRIGMGMSRNSRGAMNTRSVVSLGVALGLLNGGDARGMLLSSKAFKGNSDLLRFPELRTESARVVNMAHLGHALTALTPPVKMLMVYGCNPLSVAPDSSMVRKGLSRDDLFTVVHEQVMTPTARYADLVLPATTFLENMDMYQGYGHFYCGMVDAVISPVGEAKSTFDFYQELAETLGLRDYPFKQKPEDRLKAYVGSMEGIGAKNLADNGLPQGWICSTRRRVEEPAASRFGHRFTFVAADSTAPATPPTLLEPGEFAEKDYLLRYPLELIIPPHMDLLNSTFGERFQEKLGELLIHPDDAERYGVTEGDLVELFNHRGQNRRIARVSKKTQPGLVVAEGLFWDREDNPSSINDLTSQKLTDLGEGPTFHESRIAIRVVGDTGKEDQ